MEQRKTIKREVSLVGTGLHTGMPCRVTFRPAAGVSGIRFLRTDISGSAHIPALLANVSSTIRGTNLSAGGFSVHTVEHVLSACAALSIDDLDIHMDGPEPPAMDGSALEFAKSLSQAGAALLAGSEASVLAINSRVEYKESDIVYEAEPADGLEFGFVYEHQHPLVRHQQKEFVFSESAYMTEIAPARTFGFQEEIEYLKQMGLARGGSLENAVVITAGEFLAEGGLRFPDELVRHKILDLIGDLKLLGMRLGPMRIRAARGGHKHNIKFAEMLAETLSAGRTS